MRQMRAIEGFCKTNGLEFSEHFSEQISGKVEGLDRPEFARMLDEAAERGVGIIVVERLDRLARDLMVSELLLRELKKQGLKLFASDQGLVDLCDVTGDPTRKLIRQIMGALAEWERSMIVLKLGAARKRKKERDGRCEGAKPFGAYPKEAIALGAMLQFAREGVPNKEIARALNENALCRRNGKLWDGDAVYQTLKLQLGQGFVREIQLRLSTSEPDPQFCGVNPIHPAVSFDGGKEAL